MLQTRKNLRFRLELYGYFLYLMEKNQIRIIFTLDTEHFGKIDWVKAVNPVPDEKMHELRSYLQETI